jgi:hypothetical protein
MAGSDQEAGARRGHPGWLYARLLSGTWGALPEPVRRLHALDERLTAVGRAKVERGTGLVSRLVSGMAGFPPASDDVELRVDFERKDEVETWRRGFGDHLFVSTQEAGRGRRLVERFGPASFSMTLTWDGKRLNLRLRSWRLFGVRMPRWTQPDTTAWEAVEDGRFSFFVEISHPWAGLLVRYKGWLEPVIPLAEG